MTDIHTLAATVAKKHDLQPEAALAEVRSVARQVARFDRITLDENDIPTEQAGYVLGAIDANHKTLTPALLDAITEHANHLDDLHKETEKVRELRDEAIFAASEAGHTHAEMQTAAKLKHAAIIRILRDQRNSHHAP